MSSPNILIDDAQVVAYRVSKIYGVSHGMSRDISRFRKPPKSISPALSNVSLLARSGESIGLMGKNGSGKSTLLRLFAGSENPTRGKVLVRHRPTSLGVTPALVPHLDAWDNARMGLLAMGLGKSEVNSLVGEVVEWTELGDDAKRPMSTYSTGQAARLSFAISTVVRPNILIVDEALSTGDMGFAEKARGRMAEVLEGAGTLFLVSHSVSEVERTCSRVVWLNKGEVVADGPTEVVSGAYKKWQHLIGAGETEKANKQLDRAKQLFQQATFSLSEVK